MCPVARICVGQVLEGTWDELMKVLTGVKNARARARAKAKARAHRSTHSVSNITPITLTSTHDMSRLASTCGVGSSMRTLNFQLKNFCVSAFWMRILDAADAKISAVCI